MNKLPELHPWRIVAVVSAGCIFYWWIYPHLNRTALVILACIALGVKLLLILKDFPKFKRNLARFVNRHHSNRPPDAP
jgi:hypothetical protein